MLQLLYILVILLLVMGGYLFWLYWYPPRPNNLRKTLFKGITYIRDVRNSPRPIIIHVVKVDLTQQNLSFLVTPPGEVTKNGKRGKIGARTTSQFLAEFNLQVAVNGSFFYPYSSKFWSYYPRLAGDPVNPFGFASSRGQVYSPSKPVCETFYISADNQAQFQVPIGAVYNAISGGNLLIKQGKIHFSSRKFKASECPYPRTALALDKTAKTLMIFVVDGKQKNYSEGVTLAELVEIIQAYGGDTALNMDGGGSATLVIEAEDGKPMVLNSPIHARIRGRERLVANHLGIAFPDLVQYKNSNKPSRFSKP